MPLTPHSKDRLRTAACTTLCLLFAAFSAHGQVIRYNFNEGAGTAANSGSAGTVDLDLGASSSWSASGAGVSGQAGDYAFQGTASANSWATNPTSSPVTALNDLTSFTITGWLDLADATPWADDKSIINVFSGFDNGFKLTLRNGGELGLQDRQFSYVTSATSGAFGAVNGWLFFAVTWDGTGVATDKVDFYLGTASSTSSLVDEANRISGGDTNAAGYFRVGNNARPGDGFWTAFTGKIDDIRVYSSGLDASAIEAVRLSAVPEPGSAIFLALSAGAFFSRRRRACGPPSSSAVG